LAGKAIKRLREHRVSLEEELLTRIDGHQPLRTKTKLNSTRCRGRHAQFAPKRQVRNRFTVLLAEAALPGLKRDKGTPTERKRLSLLPCLAAELVLLRLM
jgi:hypothetical protein